MRERATNLKTFVGLALPARTTSTDSYGMTQKPSLEEMADIINSSFLKRFFDIVLSLLGLIALSPLFLLIPLSIFIASPGPIFFVHKRYGLNSRLFNMYKFRTMTPGADRKRETLAILNEMNGPAFKIKGDPRVYPFGQWLRKFSLDELPQLWNVLKGDMSIVGPRPFLLGDEKSFKPWHYYRHLIKPGVTSYWQIMGRNDISDFDEWAELDLKYIQSWTIWEDIKIVSKTPVVVLRGTGY